VDGAPRRFALSLPTKVFLSFAAIIVAFGLTMGYALVRQRATLRDLTLVAGGLLPVTLTVAEVRNTQELLVTTLESDPERRLQWLALVRQLRPASLRRTARSARQAAGLASESATVELLAELAQELDDVAAEAVNQEPDYRELFVAIEARDDAEATALLYSLVRREREIAGRLERVQGQLDARITLVARSMESAERQLIWALLVLTVGALVVSAGLTLFSYRALARLSRLTDGVIAVGAGDLAQHVDISTGDEIGALAREFNRMTARLAEREERLVRSERLAGIGKFVAKVTHDIRNPLNAMGMSAEMLHEDLLELVPAESRDVPLENLRTIMERLEDLHALTSEYLAFARPNDVHLEPTDLDDFIESHLEGERASAAERGVEIRLDLAYDLPAVAIDGMQLRRVLSNLLRNAVEAMPDGGTLTVRTRRVDGGAVLDIEDEGAGVDPGDVERIFDHFYTTKARGTGLGLPNALDIVVKHRGRLTCRPAPSRGSIFTVFLPASEGGAAARGGEREEGLEHDQS
jgi:signal transduction histidine kinase